MIHDTAPPKAPDILEILRQAAEERTQWLLDSKWKVQSKTDKDAFATRYFITTDYPREEENVMIVDGWGVQDMSILGHICFLHNKWLEQNKT